MVPTAPAAVAAAAAAALVILIAGLFVGCPGRRGFLAGPIACTVSLVVAAAATAVGRQTRLGAASFTHTISFWGISAAQLGRLTTATANDAPRPCATTAHSLCERSGLVCVAVQSAELRRYVLVALGKGGCQQLALEELHKPRVVLQR